jgi:hypothetical protein
VQLALHVHFWGLGGNSGSATPPARRRLWARRRLRARRGQQEELSGRGRCSAAMGAATGELGSGGAQQRELGGDRRSSAVIGAATGR